MHKKEILYGMTKRIKLTKKFRFTPYFPRNMLGFVYTDIF